MPSRSTVRILFVDDMLARINTFREVLARAGIEADIVHRAHAGAVTVEDVRCADVLFLDFDMCAGPADERCPSTGSHTDCDCPDGLALAGRLIAEDAPPRPAVIHSATWSRDKRDEMARLLANAGWRVVVSPINEWRDVVASGLVRRWGLVMRSQAGREL